MKDLIWNISRVNEFYWSSLGKQIFDEDGILGVITGLKQPLYNNIISTEIEEKNIGEIIEKVVRFFEYYNLPWSWSISPNDHPPGLPMYLKSYGFNVISNLTTMIYDLNCKLSYIEEDNFEIKKLLGNENLNDWIKPIKEVFGFLDDDADKYKEAHIKANSGFNNFFHHYVLYIEKQPIASSSIIINRYGAKIANIAVCNDYIKKGLGKAIIIYSLKEVQKFGHNWCYIEVPDKLKQIFSKVGFQEIYKIIIYSRKY